MAKTYARTGVGEKATVSTICEERIAKLFKSGMHLVDPLMIQSLSFPKVLLAIPKTIATYIEKAIIKKKMWHMTLVLTAYYANHYGYCYVRFQSFGLIIK